MESEKSVIDEWHGIGRRCLFQRPTMLNGICQIKNEKIVSNITLKRT